MLGALRGQFSVSTTTTLGALGVSRTFDSFRRKRNDVIVLRLPQVSMTFDYSRRKHNGTKCHYDKDDKFVRVDRCFISL